MTIRELKDFLEGLDPNTIIILQKDGEGNDYSPLFQCEMGNYHPENAWSGKRDDYWETYPGALFLIPAN